MIGINYFNYIIIIIYIISEMLYSIVQINNKINIVKSIEI